MLFRLEQLEDPYLLMEIEVLFEHMKQIYLLSWHAPLSLPTNERRQMSGGRALVTYSSTSISYPPERRRETRETTLARFCPARLMETRGGDGSCNLFTMASVLRVFKQ